jgi:hypothetical protein
MRSVRVGNGCGFWGDNADAPRLLAGAGRLDYLTLEYLAELTMSILALQKQRDASAGFATDFLDVLESLLPILRDQPGLKIITNAGGMNPRGCAEKARALLDRAGLGGRRIGVVAGDDLMPRIDELLASGQELRNLDTGAPLHSVRDRLVSANAYLGSAPIVEALGLGSSLVITGRVADACLTVAPAVFEHGWRLDDWDRLAGATVAGHLIECGAQATGGLWLGSAAVDLGSVGYPFVDMTEDGSFRISKPSGTGGAVNRQTVAEQLLYEVGDPAAYLTPDVTADFTSVALAEEGPDVVAVTGARGRPVTGSYKVSCAYRDGWSSSGTLVVAGPGAAAKARRCGEIIRARLRRAGAEPECYHVECLGAGDSLPDVLPVADPPEVVLRVYARDRRRAVVERFTREQAP